MKNGLALCFFALFGMISNAWAIEKNDPATAISKGTQFIAQSDLTILANAQKIRLASTYVDRVFQTCHLFVNPAPTERVLKAGAALVVDRTEKVKSGTMYPDGYAAVVYFDHPTLTALKCFAGEPLSDNHRVPSFGQMAQVLAERFQIIPASAEELP